MCSLFIINLLSPSHTVPLCVVMSLHFVSGWLFQTWETLPLGGVGVHFKLLWNFGSIWFETIFVVCLGSVLKSSFIWKSASVVRTWIHCLLHLLIRLGGMI